MSFEPLSEREKSVLTYHLLKMVLKELSYNLGALVSSWQKI